MALLKSVFGGTSALVAAYAGFHAEPTIEGTSVATTRAVVNAPLLVLMLNFDVGPVVQLRNFPWQSVAPGLNSRSAPSFLLAASLLVLAFASTNRQFGGGGDSYPLTARFSTLGQLRLRRRCGSAAWRWAGWRRSTLTPSASTRWTLDIDQRYPLPADTSAGIFTSGLLSKESTLACSGRRPENLKPGEEIAYATRCRSDPDGRDDMFGGAGGTSAPPASKTRTVPTETKP